MVEWLRCPVKFGVERRREERALGMQDDQDQVLVSARIETLTAKSQPDVALRLSIQKPINGGDLPMHLLGYSPSERNKAAVIPNSHPPTTTLRQPS
jgi:hypothetical protein